MVRSYTHTRILTSLTALGLDDDQIRTLSINIPKRSKKGKKPTPEQLEEDLNFELRPLLVREVPSILNAIRKALGNTRPMLMKLLSRLQVSLTDKVDDVNVLTRCLR